MASQTVKVRRMRPGEAGKVRNLLKSQTIIDGVFFRAAFNSGLKEFRKGRGACLIAVMEGEIVGMAVLKLKTVKGTLHGLIEVVATDKNYRGRGIGKTLITESLEWFEKRGCRDVYALIDKYNSPSWNMVTHFGFSEYTLSSQIRDHSMSSLKLWPLKTYLFGIGVFKMKKQLHGQEKRHKSSVMQFIAAWFISSLIWMMAALHDGSAYDLFPYVLFIAGVSMLATELSHVLIARWLGLRTVFRVWYPGLLLSIIIVSIGGRYLAYGSVYVKQTDWSYHKKLRTNGSIYLMGPLVNIMMIIACAALLPFASSQNYADMLKLGYGMNILMAIFNVLPIAGSGGFGWDGMKIYRWNKVVWLVVVALLTAIIVISPFGAF